MGNTESEPPKLYVRPNDSQAYQLANDSNFTSFTPSFQIADKIPNRILLKTAYHGIWSMEYPQGAPPEPRNGQCSVFDPIRNELIIAYGVNESGKCLNDAWILNIPTFTWRNLSRGLLSPRQYPSATLIGRKMYIFGGVSNLDFYTDLHSIDIDTGVLTVIETTGIGPSPRTSPIFFSSDNNLFIWSGFDGNTDNNLYSLNINELNWKTIPQEMTSRSAACICTFPSPHQQPFCQNNESNPDDEIFVFGSTKGTGLLTFNKKTLQFDSVNCTGPAPLPELTHPSMIAADEYIFVIGGEATLGHMYLFALEVKRKWWFAFHVRPDNNSLTLTDGVVSKIGLFMMPREHSSALAYNKSTKELISVMGSRLLNPTPAFKVAIGVALGVLHLRSDMYEMFRRDLQDL